MQIIESWEDHNGTYYAIVRHTEREQHDLDLKQFEAMWLNDRYEPHELNCLGLTVGFQVADFDTLIEAQEYLLKGITTYDVNSNIWWEMLAA